MRTVQISHMIAKSIFNWDPVDEGNERSRLYMKPNGRGVEMSDFVVIPAENLKVREEMARQGFTLEIDDKPTDLQEKTGRNVTASFSKAGNKFEAKATDENLAVCLAALEAMGVKP